MINCDDFFGGLVREEYERQTREHFEWHRNMIIIGLIDEFAEKHELAKECGAEYIYQSDRAQIDAIELVAKIFDLYTND